MKPADITLAIGDMELAAVKRAEAAYRDGTLGPVVTALESAESFEAAQAALGADLLGRMDVDSLTNDLAETGVVAAAIGKAQESPREPDEFSKNFSGFLQGE